MMRYVLMVIFSLALLLSASLSTAQAKEGEPAVLFVELQPLILPVIDKYGTTKTVSLVVAIEVDSQEKADQVTKFSPRLTDAYLSDLYGALSHKATEGGIIPITYLKKRLNVMSAKVLGDEVVSDVLVQVMQTRNT